MNLLSDHSKNILPLAVYWLTDYCHSRLHHQERLVNPVSAQSTALSHSLVLIVLILCSYFWYRKIRLPKFSISAALTSLSLSLLFRFNVLDLNHNFGEPAYKSITTILLPLILFIHGAEKYGCVGAFLAMLLSNASRSQPLPMNQVLLGGVLSLATHVGLYFLFTNCLEKQVRMDNLNSESKISSFLDVSSDLFLGIVFCDIMMALFDKNELTSYGGLRFTSVSLFALSNMGKFFLLYSHSKYGAHALMADWIIKTVMFSFTYTLGYKFDLTISNLLAIILWILYVMGCIIVSRLKAGNSSNEVKYVPVLSHLD